jgi:hypothetical protein
MFRGAPGGGMYVIKRDGRQETVQFDKITARIKKLVWIMFIFMRVDSPAQ